MPGVMSRIESVIGVDGAAAWVVSRSQYPCGTMTGTGTGSTRVVMGRACSR